MNYFTLVRYFIYFSRRLVDAGLALTQFRDNERKEFERQALLDETAKEQDATDKKRSLFGRFLDIMTAPSVGMAVTAIAAFSIVFITTNPVLITTTILYSVLFAGLEITSRAKEYRRVRNIQQKKAAIDLLETQNEKLEKLIDQVMPGDSVEKKYLQERLVFQKQDKLHEQEKFKKSNSIKSTLASEIPFAIYSIALNVVTFNPVGLGLSTSAALLGTSGALYSDAKHEESVHETTEDIKTRGARMGINENTVMNTTYVQNLNIKRQHHIAIFEAIKDTPPADKTPEEVVKMYKHAINNLKTEDYQQSSPSFLQDVGTVFKSGFDRNNLKHKLDPKFKMYDEEYQESVSSISSNIQIPSNEPSKSQSKEHVKSLEERAAGMGKGISA